MGAVLSRLWSIPHVYDMHSSLSQQFANFDVTQATWIHRILQVFERYALRSSDAVIAICPYLGDYAGTIVPQERVFVIENTPEADTALRPSNSSMSVPAEFRQNSIVLYAGTFETYQGLDLLIESVPFVMKERADALFLLVGGDCNSVELLRKQCDNLGVSKHVKLVEKVPVEEISRYFEFASVLVSPRKSGTNTPLKIYSYLRSGKPIVATDLVTHTQVLNSEIAILTVADPESFAEGILKALSDPEIGKMVQRAKQTAEEKYSYREYIAKTSRLYAFVSNLKRQNRDLNPAPSKSAFKS
jgi:glycosyltransferase involved in cell wall biosynthesis